MAAADRGDEMSIFPHDEVPSVAVVRVGDPPDGAARAVVRTYEEGFGVPVDDRGRIPVPGEVAGDPEPHAASAYEEAVDEHVDEAYDVTVAVTDRGLQHWGSETFGTWDDEAGRTVLSTDRLTAAPEGDRWRERFRTLSRSMAGLLFGLEMHDGCVMAPASDPAELDDNPDTFCTDCEDLLTAERTAPEPPDWRVLTRQRAAARRADRWEQGDVRLHEYPFYLAGRAALGLLAVRDHLGGWSSPSLPRSVRAFVHETYRIGRFWWKVASFLLAYVVVAGGLATVLGVENFSDVQAWLLLAASLPLAWLLSELANAILAGLARGVVEGFRLAFGDDLGPEE